MTKQFEEEKDFLFEVIVELPKALRQLCTHIFSCPLFNTCPGSISNHHSYEGGLLVHTAEVVRHCIYLSKLDPRIDYDVLVTSAILHDYGKVFEYKLNNETDEWEYSEHRETHGHIQAVLSYINQLIVKENINVHIHDLKCIEHCILAHHGRPEWGSPVTPKTKEAISLHLADMISAFVNSEKKNF